MVVATEKCSTNDDLQTKSYNIMVSYYFFIIELFSLDKQFPSPKQVL